MRPIDPAIAEQIKSAPYEESHEDVAKRLGVSWATVQRYRQRAREEAEEQARGIRAEHTRQHVTDALTDLADARRMAREDYEGERQPTRLRTWLEAIRLELDQLGPGRMTDQELMEQARAIVERYGLDGEGDSDDADSV
jgi:FKBP-type peptidyl-prolyl cis-trans isomerase (trigger factor)